MGHFSRISRSKAKVLKLLIYSKKKLHILTFIRLFQLIRKRTSNSNERQSNWWRKSKTRRSSSRINWTKIRTFRWGLFFIEISCLKLQLLFCLQISHWKTCLLGFLDWSRNTLVFKLNANNDWLNLKWNQHQNKSVLKSHVKNGQNNKESICITKSVLTLLRCTFYSINSFTIKKFTLMHVHVFLFTKHSWLLLAQCWAEFRSALIVCTNGMHGIKVCIVIYKLCLGIWNCWEKPKIIEKLSAKNVECWMAHPNNFSNV